MILDHRHIDYFKLVASKLYLPNLLNDYGNSQQEIILNLTDTISNIYKYLKYNSFQSVVIFAPIDGVCVLKNIGQNDCLTIKSYDNLSPITASHIVIEVRPNGELNYLVDIHFDINSHLNDAIIYEYIKSSEIELFYGKERTYKLPSIPDSDSYFAIQTYKDLDLALEDYSTKIALHSECGFLKDIWADKNKIFFKPKPEHILRDSLTNFLKIRLRNTEVRPEQNVDKSHPVDIKITWNLANHLALIEIKWLGKSLPSPGKRFKQIYNRQRALDGAKQLAEYLDANMIQAPVKTTKGYLVIFDARRWGCTKDTTNISLSNGTKYKNEIITFVPDYSSIRTDFAKPFKFFMQPSNM